MIRPGIIYMSTAYQIAETLSQYSTAGQIAFDRDCTLRTAQRALKRAITQPGIQVYQVAYKRRGRFYSCFAVKKEDVDRLIIQRTPGNPGFRSPDYQRAMKKRL